MPTPIPFIIYGTVRDNKNNVIYNATVSVSTVSTTTDSSGKYQLNVQEVATDNTSTTVTVSYNSKSTSSSFTLSLNDIGKNLDFTLYTGYQISINSIKGKRIDILSSVGKKVYIYR